MDRISALPDPILRYIVSLLPLKSAVTSGILSTGWKGMWKGMPHLRFYRDEFYGKNFPYIVSRVLLLHNGPIDSLVVHGGCMHMHENIEISEEQVGGWLTAAVKHNVRSITLSRIPIPLKSFKYQHLLDLTIEGKWINVDPNDIQLPCLKKLQLLSNYYYDDSSLPNFICGCSALEELLFFRYLPDRGGQIHFSIESKSLKTLNMDFMDEKICDVDRQLELNVTAVQHLTIEDCCAYTIKCQDLSCINVVEIFLSDYAIGGGIAHSNNVFQLFNQLSNARKLSFRTWAELPECPLYSLTPTFPNLREVDMAMDSHYVTIMLEKAPTLESLTVRKLFDRGEGHWQEPRGIEKCLSSTLKHVSFHDLTDQENDFSMVDYILEHGRVLEKMELVWGKESTGVDNGEDRMKIFDRVCSFPRASALCVMAHKFRL